MTLISSYVVTLFAAHATCSISMVLLNKTIAQGFDFPWTVLFVQNVSTVFIGYVYACIGSKSAQIPSPIDKGRKRATFLGIPIPKKLKSKVLVVTQVMFFMGTLFTSLKALKYISVPLYVVARNTVPAQTALLERVVTGTSISAISAFGLLSTVLGAVVFTYGDLQSGLDGVGLAYAAMLTSLVSCCSVVDKMSVKQQGEQEDITPAEVNQLRVALALPVNAAIMFYLEFESVWSPDELFIVESASKPSQVKTDIFFATAHMSKSVVLSFALSTIFGYGMGTFNFYLQQNVSAATVQVANILYKLSTTVLSRFTHPSPVALMSWLGYSISLFGIALYTFGPEVAQCPFRRSSRVTSSA